MKYINTYNTQTEYSSDTTRLYPNVSYVKATQKVQWLKSDPTAIVTKFVTERPYQRAAITPSQQLFSSIKVDGESQTIGSGNLLYTFVTAGEHEVVYKLVNTSTLGNTAFASCGNMASITLPNTITTLDTSSLQGCTRLTSIIIPDSVTTINDYAFSNCTGLTSLTVPSSVTTVKQYAFSNCTGLTNITSLATTPPTIQSNTFANVPATCAIYVPAASVDAYKAASGWSERADYIQAIQ